MPQPVTMLPVPFSAKSAQVVKGTQLPRAAERTSESP